MNTRIAKSLLVLTCASSLPISAGLPERQLAIDRCTAIASMLASAYAAHPDDVELRTNRINRDKPVIQDRLGTTDMHLMSAYAAMAFYDGRRGTDAISRADPIDSVHIAAEGSARCMAATYSRDAP